MSKTVPDVGPLELATLGILNSESTTRDGFSVTEIQSSLKASGHDLAYTTVMTVLVRLHGKGLVDRRKEGRAFLYSAARSKSSSPVKLFEKLKSSLFPDSRLKPILHLLDSADDLSREELQMLKKAVEARLKSGE